jgi:hypothetical protein
VRIQNFLKSWIQIGKKLVPDSQHRPRSCDRFSFPDLSGVATHGDMGVKITLVTEAEDERTESSLNRFIEREGLSHKC